MEDVITTVDGNLIKSLELHPHLGYNPIPLSEEWLIKLGFEKDNTFGFKHKEDTAGVFVTNGLTVDRRDPLRLDKFKTGYFVETYYSGIEIKSVHQLQNLFYSLTGKELQLKQ